MDRQTSCKISNGEIKMSNYHQFEKSTSVKACDYNDAEGKMIIHFVSGSSYSYECDKSVYLGLKAAESPGSHFHKHVRHLKSERI